MLGAEHEDVWLYAEALQVVDRMLCGLSLQLACSGDVWHVCEVEANGVSWHVPSQLSDGLKERQTLDVADGAAYFCDDEVIFACVAQSAHVFLYLVGDVRDDLDGASEIASATLTLHDVLVDASCGDVVGACGLYACEALVVAKVKVSLLSVDGDVALAMLIGIECAWVYVDIRVVFLNGDVVATRLQQFAEGGRDDAFAKGADHSACDKNVLCSHDVLVYIYDYYVICA